MQTRPVFDPNGKSRPIYRLVKHGKVSFRQVRRLVTKFIPKSENLYSAKGESQSKYVNEALTIRQQHLEPVVPTPG